ncbi:MAG: hypothetical protein KDD34_09485, partial [Bdellovibrionales bacterium]|nr:hypothetical protein [Bdellovibrionales bacterium]
VYVREWNTYVDWLVFGTSSGATANYDVTGTEGINCPYDSDFNDSCNDYGDWEDLLNDPDGANGAYNTITFSNDRRRLYFPEVKY